MISSAIYGTTYHAQDFKDVAGDEIVGRKTLPMVYPSISRYAYLFLALFWSIAIGMSLQIKSSLACIPLALGFLTGIRFVIWRSIKSDQLSFVLHGVCRLSYNWHPCFFNVNSILQIWVYSIFLMMGNYRYEKALQLMQSELTSYEQSLLL